MLVKVPQGVDPKDAVLFDVICVSLHGVRNSAFKFGDNVVVLRHRTHRSGRHPVPEGRRRK